MEVETLHLYCVVGTGGEMNFGSAGLSGRQVSAIRHRDIAVLVSRSPVRAYNSMKREEVIPHLFAHQAFIENVMEGQTVVPVKFGTTARDEEEVRTVLERGYSLFKAALEAMQGRIELDLVAWWRDLPSVFRQIGEEPEIKEQKAAIAARSPEETGEDRVRLGKLVKARLDQIREERAAEIVDSLKPLAQDVCLHALSDDRMILNAALLVDKDRQREVGETLDRLNGRYAERVDFRCVGPLPPYSFSTVEIRRFDPEELEQARRLLGLGARATLSDVKAAYRRLAHQYHPDKAPARQGTAGRFEEVAEAYRLLVDYHEASGPALPDAEATGGVAVKLLQWTGEAARA